MSLLPSLSCVGLACVPDVLQHHFFMTAYLIDLSDKTVCVCACVRVHICELFLGVTILRAGLCGRVASLVICQMRGAPGISEQ